MTSPLPESSAGLEPSFNHWRRQVQRAGSLSTGDVAALEQRLRAQVAALRGAGLDEDEALLVAARRLGASEPRAAAFVPVPAAPCWHPLEIACEDAGGPRASVWHDAAVAFSLALLAALAIKAPALFGLQLDQDAGFYARNLGLFVLPLLTGYFLWKRAAAAATRRWLALAFIGAAVVANAYTLPPAGDLEGLAALHLPIALWLAVGIAHAGGRWQLPAGRMDFVRFSGELFIHYVLIALGGAVLCGLMLALFESIGIDLQPVFRHWFLPCGAMGAVLIAAWLVEARQGVAGHLAPLLTRLFAPLFTTVLLAFLATLAWTGRGLDLQRNLLIAFDLLLVVVLGLLLYAVSARDPHRPPGAFDRLLVVLVISALAVDALALWAIAARISEFGFTPNRVAALGENLILLANLAGSALLYLRFLRGRGTFAALERWQTNYLPVYAAWAAFVVIAFPPLFGSR